MEGPPTYDDPVPKPAYEATSYSAVATTPTNMNDDENEDTTTPNP